MAVRQTGWAMLASNSVQEVMDFALLAQVATLEARVPFVHFFDGFRTSHEIAQAEQLDPEDMKAMLPDSLLHQHRARALSPDHPFVRGTAQNPDVYFQAREAANPYYLAVPRIVQNVMDKFAQLTGRQFHLFDYAGAQDAEYVIVLMGSGAEVAQEAIEHLNRAGEKLGVVKVRLYRPFSIEHFMEAIPSTVRGIAVLDRTKECGSVGEPLYLDVVAAHSEGREPTLNALTITPQIIGGRYGLSSKEFTPAMVKGVFDELKRVHSKNHFTVGIHDDVTHTSIAFDPEFSTEDPQTVRALFYGLGSDGTVGANKNSIKIIGESTELFAQGYFVYDSKKSGSTTVSHLRFGPQPIRSSYLIRSASFVACHQFSFLERLNVLRCAERGATFLLNSPFPADTVWNHLPRTVQQEIITKKLRFFVIDGYKAAQQAGMGGRVNTIMQTCFFALSNVLPREDAIAAIKNAVRKTYGKRGVVARNCAAIDGTLKNLVEVAVPAEATSESDVRATVSARAPEFVREVLAPMIRGEGDSLPVSKLPADGTYPSGTAQREKRNTAMEIPAWDTDLCIQCGKCVLVCPHSALRAKLYDDEALTNAPASFLSAPARWKNLGHMKYTLQVAPEDCTGCSLCVEVCPAKSKTDASHKAIGMVQQREVRVREAENWEFFLNLPEFDREKLSLRQVKDVQLLQPLFEFSGACAGCGETPYLKLLSQLFGDRTVVANATGCSSIYGGNLPTTPYTFNNTGRGIAWSNSLFEDNAEFGLGIRLAQEKQTEYARYLLQRLADYIGVELVDALLHADQSTEAGIHAQRDRAVKLKLHLQRLSDSDVAADACNLLAVADLLVKRSTWIVGGDGWAYDIGYGGLDHVLASGENVNILVLDSEVYSNTGGQRSKSTPRAAVAKFASGGKDTAKKDLALMAMNYRNVYVARVALGAGDTQALKAFLEAEAYDGPSLILAYAPCIAHGFDLIRSLEQQKLAVQSGHWPLFRYNPKLRSEGDNPFQLDSQPPSIPLENYIYNESRYTALRQTHPELARKLLEEARQDVLDRWKTYEAWANPSPDGKTRAKGQAAETLAQPMLSSRGN